MAGRLSLLGAGKQSVAKKFQTPTDIAGCGLWLDFSDADTMFTDAGSTNVAADGDKVYQVNDKSAGGHNLVQATEDNRPVYKVNAQNGKSTLLLESLDWMGFSSTTPQTPITIIYAGYRPYGTQGRYSLSGAAGANYFAYFYGPTIFRADGGSDISITLGTSNSTNMIITGTHASDGGAFLLYNGKTQVHSTTSTGLFGAYSYLGRGSSAVNTYTSGIEINVFEILIYNSVLSQTDRETLVDYLMEKWGIT